MFLQKFVIRKFHNTKISRSTTVYTQAALKPEVSSVLVKHRVSTHYVPAEWQLWNVVKRNMASGLEYITLGRHQLHFYHFFSQIFTISLNLIYSCTNKTLMFNIRLAGSKLTKIAVSSYSYCNIYGHSTNLFVTAT